jgi:hypothetical protein
VGIKQSREISVMDAIIIAYGVIKGQVIFQPYCKLFVEGKRSAYIIFCILYIMR